MNDKIFVEKSLKSYIKTKKIGYTTALLVNFLITGNIAYGEDLSISELKSKIEKNNKRIEEIERRTVELLKEGDYYAKTLEKNKQFFFPLDIEHRHSRKHYHLGYSKGNSEKPNVPDYINGGTPMTPSVPNKKPVTPTDKPLEIGEIKKQEVTAPNVEIKQHKPDIDFKREYIADINLSVDGENIKVHDINVDENIANSVEIPNYMVKVNPPIKHYTYVPTVANDPEPFKVGDIERPKDVVLPEIKVNTISFVQGGGGIKKTDPKKDSGFEGQVVENYKSYDTGKDGLDITFTDEKGKDSQKISYNGLENFSLTTVNGDKVNKDTIINNFRTTFYSGREGKIHVGQNASFISSTMGKDSTINGTYNLKYEKALPADGVFKNSKIFLSVNPAGLGNEGHNYYNGYGKVDGGQDEHKKGTSITSTTEFTGVLNLNNKQDKGTLIGIDHEFYDTGIKNYNDNNYYASLSDLNTYSIAKNSGTINLGNKDGEDKNLVGITIAQKRETSALLKLKNHVTYNNGEININGQESLGISYEYGGGAGTEKNGLVLASDLYVGNINLNETSKNSYGVRLQNVFYNNFSGGAKEDFTNKHFYDNTRIFGSLSDNQGNEHSNIDELNKTDTKEIKKIKVDGTNNAGFVVAKSLSDGAERYLAITDKNKVENIKNNIRDEQALDNIYGKENGKNHLKEDYIGKFNSDLGKDFTGFDYGEVNPIANIHGLNIEVNRKNSVGFLRYRDYSDNNTNDMVITKNDTGAIKEIDFGKDASGSVLIRSDMYGIEVQKDLNIGKDGTDGKKAQEIANTVNPDEKPEKNIILQATKSIWDKAEEKILSVGHIINSGEMKSSQDNMIGMMANTVNPEEFEKNKDKATALNKYDKKDAEIINKKDIILSGKNVIGMAVLDGNNGTLENGKVITKTDKLSDTTTKIEEIKDYNVSIYNNGNFDIKNSNIETSGKGSIALYNNEGTVNLTTERNQDTEEGTNNIKATDGAIGIYSKGGTIKSNGKLNITTDTGIGVYAVGTGKGNANVTLDGATIKVGDKVSNKDGDAGLVAIGKLEGLEETNPNTKDIKAINNEATINLENSTLDYSGKGYALYAEDGGKINVKNSTINLDGHAFGMKVEYSEDNSKLNSIQLDDKTTINVKSNDVTVFNIVSTGENKFDSNLSKLEDKIGTALGVNGDLLNKIHADTESGITSYKTAMVDGGSLTIDTDISKKDTKENNKAGYFYFKRFLGERLNTTVNEGITIDATVTAQDSKDYYDGKATGLEIVSSKNAKSVDETSLTLKTGSSINANRLGILDGEKAEDKRTVGVFSDYAKITMEDGSSIIVEEKDSTQKDDGAFNGVGIFAANGSIVNIGNKNSKVNDKAKITVNGDNAIGIYAKADRVDENGNIIENEYGSQAIGQGKINVTNNGIIDVSNGTNTTGIYANNNSNNKNDNSNSVVINNGIIKGGKISDKESSVGIYGKNTQISNKGTIEVENGTDKMGGIGIRAAENSVVKDIGTIRLGKDAIGVSVDETSKIELENGATVEFKDKNEILTPNRGSSKIGIGYVNNKEREHNFNIDASKVEGIKVIATTGGTLKSTGDITINDKNSMGIVVGNGTAINNGIINIEKSKLPSKDKVSVGMIATDKNGTISNEGIINLTGDNAIGLYVLNQLNQEKDSKNLIDKVGQIHINGKNNKGIYVNNSNDPNGVKKEDLDGINFGIDAENSTGLYLKNSKVAIKLGEEALTKDLGSNNAGNVFIRAIDTKIQNDGYIFINAGENINSTDKNIHKNIGIMLDENSTYSGGKLNNNEGVLEASNGVIGIYSKVGDSKDFKNLKLIVDSNNKETVGLILKGKEKEEGKEYKKSEVKLATDPGRLTEITLKNKVPSINTKTTEDETLDPSSKSIGIIAKDVNLNVGNLALKYDGSNGIGIYLKDNSSITGGKIKIEGKGTPDSTGKTPFNIGVYVKDGSTDNLTTDLTIEKDNTIGIFNDAKKLTYNGDNINIDSKNSIGIYSSNDLVVEKGQIIVSGGKEKGEASVGIYNGGRLDKDNKPEISNITFKGNLQVNGKKDAGIFAKYANIINNGKIEVNNGVGVILKGEGSVFNGKDGVITTNINNEEKVTGIYLVDGAKLGNGIGELHLGKNDIAIYGENTIVDGSSFTVTDKDKRGKIDISSSQEGAIAVVVNGNTKTEDSKKLEVKNLDLKLGEKGKGIVVLHNNTKIDNVKIESKSMQDTTTGIYVKNDKDSKNGILDINTVDISLNDGYGIYIDDNTETDKRTVNLSNSSLAIKEEGKPSGTDVVVGKNTILNSTRNKYTAKNSIGIYGKENSVIKSDEDTIELDSKSTGIFSENGQVILGEGTKIVSDAEVLANAGGVYSKGGSIIKSAATIEGKTNTFYGLFMEGNGNIENCGNIKLEGKDNIGIALVDKEDAVVNTIKNSGTIEMIDISTSEDNVSKSIGIYGENANIENTGTVKINGEGVGILSSNVNEKHNDTKVISENILLSGNKAIGAILTGKTNEIKINNIKSEQDSTNNIGVYLSNLDSKNINLNNISLGKDSVGIYIREDEQNKNSEEKVINIGTLDVGAVGVIVEDKVGTTTKLNIKDKLSAKENGTTIFNKGGKLEINAVEKLEVGKGSGALVHSNGGNIIFDTQSDAKDLTISVKGHNGFVLGHGANIEGTDNLKNKNLTLDVSENGTGIIFTHHEVANPDGTEDHTKPNKMDLGIEQIVVHGNGNSEKYTQGVYFNNLGEIDEKFGTKIVQTGYNTLGIILNNTWGKLETNIDLKKDATDSIGLLIENNGENKTTIKGTVNVEGITTDADEVKFGNIGIEANDSSLETIGDITIGEGKDFKNSYPVGVFASNNIKKTGKQLEYTGSGKLTVGNFGSGILTQNYNVNYTGDIKVGVGAVGIYAENNTYSSDKNVVVKGGITVGDDNLPNRIKGIAVYGKNTDISLDTTGTTEGMNILSNNRNTGILSLGQGDITYNGNVTMEGIKDSEDYFEKKDSSVGIYKYGTGTLNIGKGNWNIGTNEGNAIGIIANSDVKDEDGNSIEKNGLTINNLANLTLNKGTIGIHSFGNNILTNTGDIEIKTDIKEEDSSVGIYMGNYKENTLATGVNTGKITVDGKHSIGVQAVGNTEFHNAGSIDVHNGGIGMYATYGAKLYNDENGVINLSDENTIGMYAKGNGSLIVNNGIINANNGTGMYFQNGASLENNGTINVNNGTGIKGNGNLINSGTINISGSGSATEQHDGTADTIIDITDKIVNIGPSYIGMGGIVNSNLNINLNNPTIDITLGNGIGFKAPELTGTVGLAPNFAQSGNGFSYEIKDFVDKNSNIDVITSPLFSANLKDETDLVINKVDYKNIMKDYKYETFYNSLDDTLKSGISSDIDAIKNLNSYLESFGNTEEFYTEYAKTMNEVRGNIYSNVQSRMFDINRSFDNSFDEMEQSYNLSKDTDKYSVIYTGGDYKSGQFEIPDYKYNIFGLQYMKEKEELNYDNKYGYTFGFTASKFKFEDTGKSKENIYSLKGGLHNVKYFEKDLDLLTKLDLGLNYHDMDRKLSFGGYNYKNDADFYSYYVSLDNKFRKTLFKDYQNEFGAYIGTELEYGRFTDIKEDGSLALKVKGNDYYIAKGLVGFNGTGRKYLGKDWTAKLTGDIGYSYDFGKTDENQVKLRNSNSEYTSILNEIDTKGKVTGKIGIGVERLNHLGVTLEGEASRDIERDEDYWRVGLRFNYKFNSEDTVTTLRNVFHLMDNHFDFDKDNLKPREKEIVETGSKIINTFNLKGTLRLEGHTDSCGTVKYNQGLSERRAETVKKEFMKNVKKPENIKYETQGYSELKPVDTNKTKAGRANNRRVEVKYIAK